MKELNNWLQRIFWVFGGLFLFFLMFYVVSFVLPVLLVIVSLLFYKGYQLSKQINSCLQNRADKRPKNQKAEIIDAEYEIIDDK